MPLAHPLSRKEQVAKRRTFRPSPPRGRDEVTGQKEAMSSREGELYIPAGDSRWAHTDIVGLGSTRGRSPFDVSCLSSLRDRQDRTCQWQTRNEVILFLHRRLSHTKAENNINIWTETWKAMMQIECRADRIRDRGAGGRFVPPLLDIRRLESFCLLSSSLILIESRS